MSKLDWQESLADSHETSLDNYSDLIDEILSEKEFSPFNPQNIMDAIADECLYNKSEDLDRLTELLETRDVTNLGRFVFGRIVDYWEKKAEEEAGNRLANSWGEER